MAIEKAITQGSSVETTYNRIEAIHGINRGGAAELYIGEYVSADARFSGADPVTRTRAAVRLSDQTIDHILSLIYSDPAFVSGRYEGAVARDPDPEKEETEETTIQEEEE